MAVRANADEVVGRFEIVRRPWGADFVELLADVLPQALHNRRAFKIGVIAGVCLYEWTRELTYWETAPMMGPRTESEAHWEQLSAAREDKSMALVALVAGFLLLAASDIARNRENREVGWRESVGVVAGTLFLLFWPLGVPPRALSSGDPSYLLPV